MTVSTEEHRDLLTPKQKESMTDSGKKPRVAWIAIQPTPYLLPLLRSLRESGAYDFHFFCSNPHTQQQPWQLQDEKELFEPVSYGRTYWPHERCLNPGVVRTILTQRWDAVVLAGYSITTMLCAMAICIVRRIPFVLQSDATLLKKRRLWKRALKRVLLFPVLRRCRAALGLGSLTMEYWDYVGIPDDRTFIAPFTPHIQDFGRQAEEERGQRQQIRRELGIPQDATLGIHIGRLMWQKSLDVLLNGLALMDPAHRPHLLLVGDGEDRQLLEQIAAKHSLPVTFAGFRQNNEIPSLCAASDFFVLSSCVSEPWGIVVAEAAAAALPLLLSDQVGSHPDMLEDGKNGFLVHGGTPQIWCEGLQRCMAERDNLRAMGQISKQIASSWTCERATTAALTAIDIAVTGGSSRLSPTDSMEGNA